MEKLRTHLSSRQAASRDRTWKKPNGPPTKRQTECVRNLVKEWCNSCPQGKPHRDYQSSITCERKERCADHAYSSITICILMKDVVQREEKSFWALILLLQIIARTQIERLMQEKDMSFQKQEKHKEVLTSCILVSDHELFSGLRSWTFSGFRSQTFFWFQIMGFLNNDITTWNPNTWVHSTFQKKFSFSGLKCWLTCLLFTCNLGLECECKNTWKIEQIPETLFSLGVLKCGRIPTLLLRLAKI